MSKDLAFGHGRHPMRFSDARSAEIVLPNQTDGVLESLTGGFYQVTPLRQLDNNGEVAERGATLWLHWRGEWYWDFFSYRSDVWAWVTDAQTGGNLVVVDKIEAYARHDSHYGLNKDVRLNSSSAHAHLFVGGIAVGKSGVCGSACAEKTGYPRWCAPEKCF
jgi:hypothetical protein